MPNSVSMPSGNRWESVPVPPRRTQFVKAEATCLPQRAEAVAPPVPGVPVAAASQRPKKTVTLDLANLNRTIEIYAEMRAVEEYDKMMREKKGVGLGVIAGFFKRGIHRLGRSAWIDSKKREEIREIEAGLKTGRYTVEFLERYAGGVIQGINTESYLVHEKTGEFNAVPEVISGLVKAVMAAPIGSAARKNALFSLKNSLESQYSGFTASIDQLESGIARIQAALVETEVNNFDLKLQMFDIGRIETDMTDKKESWIVRMADTIDRTINSATWVNDDFKRWSSGIIRHPTTAALAAALGVSGIRAAFAGAATGATGGMLAPLLAGALAGGTAAGVRAKREMRDRNAQIWRRGALGYETNTPESDGKSHDAAVHFTKSRQSSVQEIHDRLEYFATKESLTAEELEEAQAVSLCYVIRHKQGRNRQVNLLRYDDVWLDNRKTGEPRRISVSEQHILVVQKIRKLMGPDFIRTADSLDALDPDGISPSVKPLYEAYVTVNDQIRNLVNEHMKSLSDNERDYAIKQGIIFWGIAGVMGSISHYVTSALSGSSLSVSQNPWIVAAHPVATPPVSGAVPVLNADEYAPLETVDVKRTFWYDNGTHAPKFEHAELMTHADKAGNAWTVKSMIWQTATSSNGQSMTIRSDMFSDKTIQAVVSTKDGTVLIPIDEKGNLLIPQELKADIAARNFKTLEIARIQAPDANSVQIQPLSTVTGNGSMGLVITETLPPVDPLPPVEPLPPVKPVDRSGWVIPLGGTPYHELGEIKRSPKEVPKDVPKQEVKKEVPKHEVPKDLPKDLPKVPVPIQPIPQQEIPANPVEAIPGKAPENTSNLQADPNESPNVSTPDFYAPVDILLDIPEAIQTADWAATPAAPSPGWAVANTLEESGNDHMASGASVPPENTASKESIAEKYLTYAFENKGVDVKNRDIYAQALAEAIREHGEERIHKTKDSIRNRFQKSAMFTKTSDTAKLDTWIYWDLAKQYYYFSHPDAARPFDENYAAVDPFISPVPESVADIHQRIADRHLAWEFVENTKNGIAAGQDLPTAIMSFFRFNSKKSANNQESQLVIAWLESMLRNEKIGDTIEQARYPSHVLADMGVQIRDFLDLLWKKR